MRKCVQLCSRYRKRRTDVSRQSSLQHYGISFPLMRQLLSTLNILSQKGTFIVPIVEQETFPDYVWMVLLIFAKFKKRRVSWSFQIESSTFISLLQRTPSALGFPVNNGIHKYSMHVHTRHTRWSIETSIFGHKRHVLWNPMDGGLIGLQSTLTSELAQHQVSTSQRDSWGNSARFPKLIRWSQRWSN